MYVVGRSESTLVEYTCITVRRGLATSTPYVVTGKSGIESKPPVSNLISLEEDSLTYTTFVMLLCLDFPDQGKFNDVCGSFGSSICREG